MDIQDVTFLPFGASFPPLFLIIVVDVEALGPPQVIKLWLGVRKGMLPVKYFRSNKASFVSVELHGDHNTVTKLR